MKYAKALSSIFVISLSLIIALIGLDLTPSYNIDDIKTPIMSFEGKAESPTVSVTAIVTGWVLAPASILIDQKEDKTPAQLRQAQWVPSVAYIVQHPSRGTVIFDFGVQAGDCAYGLRPVYWVPCRNEGHMDLASYLKTKPDVVSDIIYLIPSHFHGDHISGLSSVLDITSVPLLLSDAAKKELKSKTRVLAGIPNKMLPIEMTVITMDENFTQDPLLGNTFDVFGDGSVTIFETAGHFKGHISALIKTQKNQWLLSFDAAHLKDNYDLQIPSGSVSDKQAAIDSLEHLRAIKKQNENMKIIFGHDPKQWKCIGNIVNLSFGFGGTCQFGDFKAG